MLILVMSLDIIFLQTKMIIGTPQKLRWLYQSWLGWMIVLLCISLRRNWSIKIFHIFLFRNGPNFLSLENALVQNVAAGCTIAFNSKARTLVLNNFPNFVAMHDWWFYIVISAFGVLVYDNKPSLKYRQHSSNTVGAASNIFQDFRRRTKRFFSKDKNGVFRVSDQAAEFFRCYAHLLSVEQSELVRLLVNGKRSMISRIILAIHSDFRRQSKFDNFILRILFFLGKF